MGDFLTIQPHFPAQSPSAQAGGLPVVLYEPDVVLLATNPECVQALEIALLWVAGIWLEDHLELEVVLHPVGILTVAAVLGPV